MKPSKFAIFAVFCSFSSAPIWAQNDAKPIAPSVSALVVKAQFQNLLDSITDDDYAGFMVAVDEDFKTVLTKETFENVVKTLGARLKTPYQATYFGQLRQKGYDVHFWKLHWEKGDDMLAEMSVKDEKIGGFFLR